MKKALCRFWIERLPSKGAELRKRRRVGKSSRGSTAGSIRTRITWRLVAGTLVAIGVFLTAGEGEMTAAENRIDRGQATFAGGCFWCMEAPFEELDGVIAVTAGYTGGDEAHPTYHEVASGLTGHVEAVQIDYDKRKVTYRELLDVFWRQIDPTDDGGQFADRGSQYRTVIFYHDEEQKRLAESSKKKLTASGRFKKPIVTRILPARPFYDAEAYHQNYYRTNSDHYNLYKSASGRTGFQKSNW
jgi:methionine-S-sulfoxide reductase